MSLPLYLLLFALLVSGLVVAGYLGWRRQVRKHDSLLTLSGSLIRVDMLAERGPDPAAVQLQVYHLPVRLAALVLAPAGRGAQLPDAAELGPLIEHLVPGFEQVVVEHQPDFARWPAQRSWQGFIRAFFRHVELPGVQGKGSPWCALAGRFEARQQTILVGLICRGATDNNLGQITVERPNQWLDVLRIQPPMTSSSASR